MPPAPKPPTVAQKKNKLRAYGVNPNKYNNSQVNSAYQMYILKVPARTIINTVAVIQSTPPKPKKKQTVVVRRGRTRRNVRLPNTRSRRPKKVRR